MNAPKPHPRRRSIPCAVCGRVHPGESPIPLRALRADVADLLRERHPDVPLAEDSPVCRACVSDVRTAHLLERLEHERGELSDIEREVASKAAAHESIATSVDAHAARDTTFGQRVADGVARVGGSWSFVLGFLGFLGLWMAVNVKIGRSDAFDPYPFILLNLVLSCIAALQAPIIMMSQNRAAERDRRVAQLDYRINLKAELEIAALHEKIDHILHSRWDDLVELQRTQLELLEELNARRGSAGGS